MPPITVQAAGSESRPTTSEAIASTLVLAGAPIGGGRPHSGAAERSPRPADTAARRGLIAASGRRLVARSPAGGV